MEIMPTNRILTTRSMDEIKKLTMEEVYVSPFTARRSYDEEGRVHWIPLERRTAPTGQRHVDFIIGSLAAGHSDYDWMAERLGCTREDLWGTVHLLFGMEAREFRRAYMFRLADDLLRYTSMKVDEVARRVGAGSAANLCQLYRDNLRTTPDRRRRALRQARDEDRFRV